uniref:F-box domain-containing protein n=1 Tax=Oryza glumipatula TaxID=40148 RepID=A0A0E0B7U4_9ORYZ
MSEATAGGHSSAAAESAPDDVLAEILLRLPPHPSFLSRASLVCKRWRRLARDPGFLRRLRAFHRASPVLGFFHNSPDLPRFVPAEGPPGRVAAEAASLRRDGDDGMWWFVDCRHGRALLRSRDWADLLVWDPMTGERRCITVPNQIQEGALDLNAAVFCAASGGGYQDCHSSPFHVVVVFTTGHGRVFACVYSSGIDAWGDPISTPVTSPCELYEEPPVLVGEALYWLLDGSRILEFEFGNQCLASIDHPVENHAILKRNIRLVRMEDDDVLGLAFVKDFSLHLWAREVADDGASQWIPRRAIELDMILPLEGHRCRAMPIWICGFAEDGNVVFIRTYAGVFLVWHDTLKFKKVSSSLLRRTVYSYASFYVPNDMADVGGGDSPQAAESAPDDVLAEILLRLPPHPSSLSSASLVCTRWRRLIRSPTFLRRVRAFHRTPPVLGFFHNSSDAHRFLPAPAATEDAPAPARVAAEASSVGRYGDDDVWWFLDCRHGRALLHSPDRAHFLVWDPMTGERRRVAVPHRMQGVGRATRRYATVFCTAASASHSSSFHVAVVFTSCGRVYASVYSSRVGEWGDIITKQAPFSETQILSVIDWPLEMNTLRQSNMRIVRLEGDVLGVVSIRDMDFILHLWAREVADDGELKWVPRMAIELDKLLPLPTEMEGDQCRVMPVSLCGLSEDGSVVFIQTIDGIFLVWLETLEFKVSCSLPMKHALLPDQSTRHERGAAAAESLPDDVVAEILLRLPPHPSFVSAASLVCKRWLHLIRSPSFLRRVRAFHRTPPVLGFFHNYRDLPSFVPAEGVPGRNRMDGHDDDGDARMFIDCRHGRALLRRYDWAELLVWDPMTGERRRIAVPNQKMQGGGAGTSRRSAALFCSCDVSGGGGDQDCHSSPFHVVVVFIGDGRAFACVYSSLTGAQSLTLMKRPLEMLADVRLVRLEEEEDGLGLAFIKDSTLHLWAREVADDGASKWKWIPRRAIELDKFLPMPRVLTGKWCGEMFVSISGFSEDGNVVFIRTLAGVFLVWLESLKFKKMSDPLYMMTVHPYSSFYVPNVCRLFWKERKVTGVHSSPPATATASAAESLPDDVLVEILLRLPPHPSFLSQASLVSKRWLRHTRNPSFLRRFREFHRTAPVLGFFLNSSHGALFFPTDAPPGRIADQVASLRRNSGDGLWWLVGCRHGRVLLRSCDWADLLVWDPMTEGFVCFPAPIQMVEADADRDAAVFCAASAGGDGDDEDRRSGAFNVAVVFVSGDHVFGCVFSSAIGAWGDVISTPVTLPLLMIYDEPAALAGEALYWIVNGSSLLEFNFGSQSLALISRPSDMPATHRWNIRPVSLEDDLLGLAFFNDLCLHLWVREVADDGAPNWVPRKSVEMDKLLSLPVATEDSSRRIVPAWICGFSGDGNVVFIGTPAGIFLVELDTLKFKKVTDGSLLIKTVHPYESFYYVPNEKGGKQESAIVGNQVSEAGGKNQVASEIYGAKPGWSSGDHRFPLLLPVKIIGVAEEGDVMFLWTLSGIFKFCSGSMELNKKDFLHRTLPVTSSAPPPLLPLLTVVVAVTIEKEAFEAVKRTKDLLATFSHL